MPLIDHDHLRRIYAAVAASHEASQQEADTFASCLVCADLRGYTRQGIAILPYYHRLLRGGVLRFGRSPEVLREGTGFAVLNGHRNVGQVIGTEAMAIAGEKAAAAGVGMVTVMESGDFAMASAFALQGFERDQIGIAMGNGYPIVAPWGGREPFLCTNPLAIAVPAGNEQPLVIDMATSLYSMGQVVRAARDGVRLDAKAVVNSAGEYSNDPGVIVDDPMDRESPLAGAILPGGPKGFAWMLIVEVLSGVLSGAQGSYINRIDPGPSARTQYGNCFIAIDIAQFLDLDRFKTDMDNFLRALRVAPPAVGFDSVRVPGQRSGQEYERRTLDGVPVREDEWKIVLTLCETLGIDSTAV